MINIKHILFPTDFSQPSDIARPHALELARRFDAEVTVLHVRTVHGDDPVRIRQEMTETAEDDELIERLHDMLEPSGGPVPVHSEIIRNVSPAAGILDYLAEKPIDLTVIGTHGRNALSHFLLGSVAEKVVRHAPCPVLTVGHMRKSYSPHYRNILAAFDFSEHSRLAVRNGVELAKRFEAQLQVLYVLEQEVHPAYYEGWRETMHSALPQIAENARESLNEILSEEGMQDLQIHVEIGGGRAHREIADFADRNNVDLILMGTHGLSGLEHMLLGSTTERVVRIAHCPVLTFKLPPSK